MYQDTHTQEVILDTAGGWAVTKKTDVTYSLENLADYKTRLAGEKSEAETKITEVVLKIAEVDAEVAKISKGIVI